MKHWHIYNFLLWIVPVHSSEICILFSIHNANLPHYRFFSESHEDAAETPTTPTNEGYRDTTETEPHIPEPDYDMSDVDNVDNGDNQSYSGSESGSWRDTTATLRRNAR